jgi:GntR family transcriptional regulator of gluconate operon
MPPKSRLQPPDRSRLTDGAYTALRNSILAGEFAMGAHLIEGKLAKALEMSRAPVREALRRLATEGLVEERARQGSFVREWSADEICDLYNVRIGLELTTLRQFMRRGADTQPLWAEISAMEKAATRGQMNAVVAAELGFHRHLAEGSENAMALGLFNDLEGPLLMVLTLDDASFTDLADIAKEHIPVVTAIEAGDERAAVRVFHEHLISTVDELIIRLDGDSSRLLPPVDRPVAVPQEA